MPELPEVEAVRRTMHRALVGDRIAHVEVAPDEIVLGGVPPEAVASRLLGSRVEDIGRKGKFWWIALDERPWVFGHLGMSGWIRELGGPELRLHSHGDAPLDDPEGRPRFLKLLLVTESGRRIAFTDGRRLARLWIAEGPEHDPQVQRLGFDVHDELPSVGELQRLLAKRKAPVKALLLDQSLFAGVGNWIADEVLYRAGIAPKRPANSLSETEVLRLRTAIEEIVGHAVKVEADYRRFPDEWLFHHRWGGGRGASELAGQTIVRETIGGRTTAWVPDVQK